MRKRSRGLESPRRLAGFSRPEKRSVFVFSPTADTSSGGPFISLSFPRGITPNSLVLSYVFIARIILGRFQSQL